MKLAEALTARADLQRRIEQLRARITANARYQAVSYTHLTLPTIYSV